MPTYCGDLSSTPSLPGTRSLTLQIIPTGIHSENLIVTMSQLQKALENLRPKDFSEVPQDDLNLFLADLFSKAELIANSVPPPPNGTPFELSKRARSDVNGARTAADLTVSSVRRPSPTKDQEEIQKAWGKPLKMSSKDNATGISVFKMAGHDRHGAWFARTSVHEGLGFTKWKRAMMREFPESLEVQGGPGEGNIRGIGGDRRLEDIEVKGVGKLEGTCILWPSKYSIGIKDVVARLNLRSIPAFCAIPRTCRASRIYHTSSHFRKCVE